MTGKAYVITSGKGGVGKTTASANIGAALAQLGKRVVLVDTDIGLRNLDVVMGLENRIVYDLVDVAEGQCTLEQALVYDERFEGRLAILPAAQTRDKSAVAPDQVRVMMWELKEQFDYVCVDCPAGIEQGFLNAIAGADEAIVVTNPEIAAMRDADRVIGLLASHDLVRPKLIINRARADLMRSGDMLTVAEMVDLLGIEMIGLVPEDASNIKAANYGIPLVLGEGPASRAYKNIARRLLGEDLPFDELDAPPEEKLGFFARLFRKRKK